MSRRLSLRTRLVLGVLALAGVALVAADLATYASLRSFLLRRTDNSLETDHIAVERALSGNATPSDACGAVSDALPGIYVQLRTRAGQVVCNTRIVDFSKLSAARPGPPGPLQEKPPPLLPQRISLPRSAPAGGDRTRYFDAAAKGGGRYRVRASLDPGVRFMLIVARPLEDVDGTLRRLLLIELLVTGVVLAGIVALGLWVVRLGLRPLAAIGGTAAAIAAGDLSQRVERAEPRTEIGRLGLALNAMLGQIEAAFRAREASERRLRRFVADASHELRTPLSAVRAYAELFRRGADRRPDDLARAMAGISRESERMSVLVEDLLLLARLDEGRPLERKPVRLDELAEESVETARAVEPERPIGLTVEPAVVLGDRERLRQVLDNLLGNVRAHTPPTSPARVAVTTANGCAVIEVEDSGPGLAPEEAEQVFERFYRADRSRSRASGGIGLGLSIVAAVTEAHDGVVSATSEPERGSTFRVELPLLDPGDSRSTPTHS